MSGNLNSVVNQRILALVLLALMVFAAVSAAQERRQSYPIQPPCPKPFQQFTQAPIPVSATNLIQSDFLPAQWNASRAGLNDSGKDKHFLGSFHWKYDRPCCQVTWGRLIVQMQSNQEGTAPSAPDAGNDGFSVMSSGAVAYSKAVYTTFPVASSAPVTVNWILDQAALDKLNLGKGLSFDVQDDTMVKSATLEVRGCCVRAPQP